MGGGGRSLTWRVGRSETGCCVVGPELTVLFPAMGRPTLVVVASGIQGIAVDSGGLTWVILVRAWESRCSTGGVRDETNRLVCLLDVKEAHFDGR